MASNKENQNKPKPGEQVFEEIGLRWGPEQLELGLEGIAHELTVMVVTQLEALSDLGAVRTVVLTAATNRVIPAM